jgi:hypothetical protein
MLYVQGLSYGTFRYSQLQVTPAGQISFDVSRTSGAANSCDTPQVYIQHTFMVTVYYAVHIIYI